MQGYQTIWGPSGHDFEIVTQIASAAAWRRLYGPLDVYTDQSARETISELGLEQFYREIIALPIRTDISAAACWAWPKIEAMRIAGHWEQITCAVDADCVVWDPLRSIDGTAICGLHYDDGKWPVYHELRPLMKMMVPAINWDVQPVNAGLLMVSDDDVRETFLKFADKLAVFLTQTKAATTRDAGAVTIEQLLPVAVALSMGKRVDVFEGIHRQDLWRHEPTRIMHLWGSKPIYRRNPRSAAALMSHLTHRVKQFDREAAEAMQRIANRSCAGN